MHSFYLSLFFVCAFLTVSAQSYMKDLETDKITISSSTQTVTAYTIPLKQEVEPQNNRFYFWYSANQIRSTQGGFSGKLLNGPYSAFYSNKNLKEQGRFKQGLQHGEWKSWYDNGQLKEVIKWRLGARTGRFEEYTAEGKIQKRGRYKKGNLEGRLHTYSGKDSVNISEYKDGEPVVKVEKKKSSEPGIVSKTKGAVKKLLKKKRDTEGTKPEKAKSRKEKKAQTKTSD